MREIVLYNDDCKWTAEKKTEDDDLISNYYSFLFWMGFGFEDVHITSALNFLCPFHCLHFELTNQIHSLILSLAT